MARDKPPAVDTSGEVPLWFMTYSDVITLLMTFFILLLTFATSEPEKFERMQVSLFGGGGATGIAGDPQGPLDQDAMVMRVRPHAGRVTTRGSEMPPHHADPTLESLAKGIEGLEQENQFDPLQNHRILSPLNMLASQDAVTSLGDQRLKMLAIRLNNGPYSAVIEVADDQAAEKALLMAQHLVNSYGVLPGKVAVSVAPSAVKNSNVVGLRIMGHFNED